MVKATASTCLRILHLFQGITPLPLGHPTVAGYCKHAFSLHPGNNEHGLQLPVVFEYMGPRASQSDWSISFSTKNLTVPHPIHSLERARPPMRNQQSLAHPY